MGIATFVRPRWWDAGAAWAPQASALGIHQFEPQDQSLESWHLVEIIRNLSFQNLLIEKMSQFVADRLGRENLLRVTQPDLGVAKDALRHPFVIQSPLEIEPPRQTFRGDLADGGIGQRLKYLPPDAGPRADVHGGGFVEHPLDILALPGGSPGL